MKKSLVFVSIGVLLVILTGCATIVSTSKQKISIVSQPEKAKVAIYDSNNKMVWAGESPSNVTLNRGNGFFKGATYKIEVTKPGFQTMTLHLKSSTNGWYVGGNLIAGFVGWLIVDPYTGAMWVLNPKNFNVQLSKYDQQAEGLKVVMLNEINSEILQNESAIQVK